MLRRLLALASLIGVVALVLSTDAQEQNKKAVKWFEDMLQGIEQRKVDAPDKSDARRKL